MAYLLVLVGLHLLLVCFYTNAHGFIDVLLFKVVTCVLGILSLVVGLINSGLLSGIV